MTRSIRRHALGTAIAAILGGLSSNTFGQALDEIVVTAERRETALQQTPISVAAFTADTMELKGLETLEDIATVTPNLDIKGARGSGNAAPTYQIRGLAGGGALGERSSAMYIDGVYMPRTTGPYMSVMDIDRIEVLRGPQGTLFGRNSTGGAIRVFSKQPGPEFESYVRLTAGDYDRQDVSAMINVPLGDNVFFRAQGGSLKQDGYVSRGGQDLGSSDDSIARLQLAIEPSDTLRVTFGLSSTESESNGNPQDLETFDMNPNLNFEGNRADWVSDFLQAAGLPRIDPNDDPRIVLDDYTMPDWCFLEDAHPDWDDACAQINESDYTQFDVNVALDLNDTWSFTSITGLSEFESHSIFDFVMLGTEERHEDVESEVAYQELQLNASWDRLDLVTGISYFQEDVFGSPGTGGPNYDRRGTSVYGPTAPPAPPVPPGGLANGNGVALGTGPNGLFSGVVLDGLQETESLGVFANATWHVTERLNLTPGVRWAQDDKFVTQTRFRADDFNPFGGAPSTTVLADDDWTNTDYRLTLDYQINDNHMVYVTSSEAYRAGAYSYNIVATSSGAAQTTAIENGVVAAFTPPEKVQNEEIGVRTEWFDGRLRVNLTYFEMDYTDRQVPVQVVDSTSPTGFRIQLVSAGDAKLDGYELEGQIAATDNLMFDFSAGLLDEQVLDPCANSGEFLFPGPVEDSYSLGARWMLPLDNGAGVTFALSYAYTGPQQTHPGGTTATCFNPVTGAPNPVPGWFFDSRYELPDYALVNARVRYMNPGGDWELALFANNLTDEVYGNYASRFGGGFWDSAAPVSIGAPERSARGITRGRPREYGITFQYNFGGDGGAGN